MKRTIKFLGWTILASLALGGVLLIAASSMSASFDPTTIRFDGDSLNLDWAGLHAGDWLMATGGIALALLIVAVVAPLAVLIPLAVAALAIVGALLLVAGVLAFAFSPLIFAALVVWLIVRLVRRGDATHRADAARGSATITG